jgi:4a-hydroxytetrahydrobiopterin dehydratase
MTVKKLNDEEIAAALRGSRWTREGDAIVREFELDTFGAVIAAVNRVAAAAEERNHHPDMFIHGWNKLSVTLSTHSAGGLTAADFELARVIDSRV